MCQPRLGDVERFNVAAEVALNGEVGAALQGDERAQGQENHGDAERRHQCGAVLIPQRSHWLRRQMLLDMPACSGAATFGSGLANSTRSSTSMRWTSFSW